MHKKLFFILVLVLFLSISFVSAENTTESDDSPHISLNTSDVTVITKGQSFSATLLENSSALSNRSVTFSVNNVNYTRITDSNGIASLKINLDSGIYPITTSYNNIINNNTVYVSNISGTIISSDMSNSEIQSIIDSSKAYDTIIFKDNVYDNISLSISKNPLNIVSLMKSTLNGNGINPVFTVTVSGVNISNLKISKGSTGINVKNADNVGISDNIIDNNVNGITIENSKNVAIFNNIISNSKENGINLKKTTDVNITFNNIENNYDGIYFDEKVINTGILNNTITGSENYGINFEKSGAHTNVTYNIISRNRNGINIDCVGDEGLVIEYNTIEWSGENGIYFGSNYRKTSEKSVLDIAYNSILYNNDFNILGRASIYNSLPMGDNWVAALDPTQTRVCEKIKFNKLSLNMEQTDENTLSLSVDGIITPFEFRISYDGAKTWQTVNFVDGKATVHISNGDGNVVMNYHSSRDRYQYQLSDYVPYVEPTPSVIPDTPKDTSKTTNGTTNTNYHSSPSGSSPDISFEGESAGVLAISNVGELISSAESASSSSTTSAVTSKSSTGEVSEPSASEASKSVMKSINVDDEDIVRISGIGIILIIIIAIIGLYYRRDIEFMWNKRNEQ